MHHQQAENSLLVRLTVLSKHMVGAWQTSTEKFIMENENKVIPFSLVECDLIPNGRGKGEKPDTLFNVYLNP